MKSVSWFLLLALATTAAIITPVEAADMVTIDGAQMEALMADGKSLVIVDVREPELFVKGHLRGAINIPYEEATPRIFKELTPGSRIVFVCHGGPMGDELGQLLAEKGYPTVYNLKGGMKKWKGDVVK